VNVLLLYLRRLVFVHKNVSESLPIRSAGIFDDEVKFVLQACEAR